MHRTSDGYELEQDTLGGQHVWVARDPAVPGPYGLGPTEAEAVEDLTNAIEFWRADATDGSETGTTIVRARTSFSHAGRRVWCLQP